VSEIRTALRILHVIPAVAPRYGGPSQAIFEMCRALQKEGVEVLVAATDADGPEHLAVTLNKSVDYCGVRTIFFRRHWSQRFAYSRTLAVWVDRNVSHFDVVHIHAVFSHPCLAAARACRKHNVPYIVRPLGSLDPWSMQQKPLRKRLMWRIAACRMLKEAASIHYTTNEERKQAEDSLGLDRGVVIPLGIDLGVIQDTTAVGFFRHDHPSLGDRPYVLALSRIHPKKNFELLVETFMSLSRQPEMESWRLVIAGDGDANYLASLQALAGSDKVIFAGWLEGAAKVSALQVASLFALPSRQENFGIAAAEALACGVPVLVSEHVNLAPEIERVKAGWVTSLEPAEFARALAEAIRDAEERERRGRAGRHLANQEFSWPQVSTELIKLYGAVETNTAKLQGEYSLS